MVRIKGNECQRRNMNHMPYKKSTAPEEYINSHTTITLIGEDGGYKGQAQRTGVTAPGYPDRAVYSIGRWEPGVTLYVYDGGYLWEAVAWNAYCREHKHSPAQASNVLWLGGNLTVVIQSCDQETANIGMTMSGQTAYRHVDLPSLKRQSQPKKPFELSMADFDDVLKRYAAEILEAISKLNAPE
jgi:hypothetical protein